MVKETFKSVPEAAESKGCSQQTIINAIKRGDLNGEKEGGRWKVKNDWLYYIFSPKWTGGRTHKRFRNNASEK